MSYNVNLHPCSIELKEYLVFLWFTANFKGRQSSFALV